MQIIVTPHVRREWVFKNHLIFCDVIVEQPLNHGWILWVSALLKVFSKTLAPSYRAVQNCHCIKKFLNTLFIQRDPNFIVPKRELRLTIFRQNFTWSQGTAMQIEKALINDRFRVLKLSWKFHISTIYNFAVIYPWNLLFS